MNLEANLSLTLSKALEKGKQLTPVFGPGRTGMINLGNSCYMNSVVQVLFAMPEIRDHLLAGAADYLETFLGEAPTDYRC